MVTKARIALQSLSLAPSSRRTYDYMVVKAIKACRSLGIDPDLPLSEQSLCDLATWFCAQWSSTSLKVFMAAVRRWQQHTFGVKDLPRDVAWGELRRGIRRVYASVDVPRQAAPFSLEHLASLHDKLDLSRFASLRFWCMSLFAFFGVFRISEYASGRLRAADVQLVRVGGAAKWALVVTVQFSKASFVPQEVFLSARSDCLCPVRAWLVYRARLSARVISLPSAPAFVLSPTDPTAVSAAAFGAFIKVAAKQLGLDPSSYSGHSFRRGGTTAMFASGVPEAAIQRHGRWASHTYRSYIHHTLPQQLLPTSMLE